MPGSKRPATAEIRSDVQPFSGVTLSFRAVFGGTEAVVGYAAVEAEILIQKRSQRVLNNDDPLHASMLIGISFINSMAIRRICQCFCHADCLRLTGRALALPRLAAPCETAQGRVGRYALSVGMCTLSMSKPWRA